MKTKVIALREDSGVMLHLIIDEIKNVKIKQQLATNKMGEDVSILKFEFEKEGGEKFLEFRDILPNESLQFLNWWHNIILDLASGDTDTTVTVSITERERAVEFRVLSYQYEKEIICTKVLSGGIPKKREYITIDKYHELFPHDKRNDIVSINFYRGISIHSTIKEEVGYLAYSRSLMPLISAESGFTISYVFHPIHRYVPLKADLKDFYIGESNSRLNLDKIDVVKKLLLQNQIAILDVTYNVLDRQVSFLQLITTMRDTGNKEYFTIIGGDVDDKLETEKLNS